MIVELRTWRPADAESLVKAWRGSRDLHSQFGEADLSTISRCTDFITQVLAGSGAAQNFAICLDQRAVGNVGVSHMEYRHRTGWVSYWLAVEVRGQGLAAQGVASVAEWAFRERDLFRLEVGHRVDNPASCRVATRAAFVPEGIERSKLACGDLRFDVETHARLRPDPTPDVDLLPIR